MRSKIRISLKRLWDAPLPAFDRTMVKWSVNLGLCFVIPFYAFSMFVYPFVAGGWNWRHVHQVWYDWQSLNVGMLALTSSAIFFQAAKYYSEEQRKRDFRAAQAFLPSALSELTVYFKSCAAILIEAWETNSGGEDDEGAGPAWVDHAAPELPPSYKEAFAQSIKYAQPDIGDFLANVLAELQVHHARLSELAPKSDIEPGVIRVHSRDVLMSYVFEIGLLQARINRLFPFARNEHPFDSSPLEWDELRNAYRNLNLHIRDFEHTILGSLEAFSKRWIDRHKDEPF